MATEIKMPSYAPSMTEGTLARWLRNPGAAVRSGDVLAEVETDKALVELTAPADGVLASIVVPAGTAGVKVDALLAWLVRPGEAVPPPAAARVAGPEASTASSGPRADTVATAAAAPAAERVFASPLARRLAAQHGLDLQGLKGSGPHGRVVRIDIEAALRQAPAPKPATAPPVGTGAAASGATAEAAYDDIAHSTVRRVIAQRLTEAKQQVPHFYLTLDCTLDRLLALRAEVNHDRGEDRISINDFIVRAVALALRRVPAANASWTEHAIRRWREVDVAVAVATPGGLVTPIVRAADRKPLSAIATELKALAARARAGRLAPADYQGGGFTISNLGMYGVREFAAIVNPPQACILAVGAAEPRPVVRDGALAVATVMSCTLSVDHRVVDGAVGAEFLAAFKSLVERPAAILV